MTEWDVLVEAATERGFRWHVLGTGVVAAVVAGVRQHRDCADVVVVTDEHHAHAYRMPTGADTDVFAPSHVYWQYTASPVWTLRALLTLPEPTRRIP